MSKNSHLLIVEPALQLLPSLALAIGLEEAIVLQELHNQINDPENYNWTIENGEKWIFETYEEWRKFSFPFWNTTKIQRIFLNLEKMGLVISKKQYMKLYRIDYYALIAWTTPIADLSTENA